MHVFTHEGDLALRLASTAANDFSFPARSRISGYRLGNLTVRHFHDQNDRKGNKPRYGIVTFFANRESLPSQRLEIRSSPQEHRQPWERPFFPWAANLPDQVIKKISYYDCTDYVGKDEIALRARGVVSRALGRPALNLIAYAALLFTCLRGPS